MRISLGSNRARQAALFYDSIALLEVHEGGLDLWLRAAIQRRLPSVGC